MDKSIGANESQERCGIVHGADDNFGTAAEGGSPPKAALLAILVAGVLSMGASPVPIVKMNADRIAVQVNEAPRDLLLLISDLANVSIVETAGERTVLATTVTDSSTNLSPDERVSRLLRNSNYILEIEGVTLKRVLVLSAVDGPPAVALEHAGMKDAQPAVQAPGASSVETSSWTPMPPEERQRHQPMELLRLKLQSATPEVRLAALSSMHWRSAGDVPLAEVRLLAERDPDPRVQAAAFDVLIQHETDDEWNHTLSKLANQAGGALQRAAAQAVERLTDEATAPARVLPEADH